MWRDKFWWNRQVSNLRPTPYEGAALPLRYCSRYGGPGRTRTVTPKNQNLNLACLPISPQAHRKPVSIPQLPAFSGDLYSEALSYSILPQGSRSKEVARLMSYIETGYLWWMWMDSNHQCFLCHGFTVRCLQPIRHTHPKVGPGNPYMPHPRMPTESRALRFANAQSSLTLIRETLGRLHDAIPDTLWRKHCRRKLLCCPQPVY